MRLLKCIFVFFIFISSVSAKVIKENESVYTQDKLSIVVSANQPEFVIKLKSNPTTGYSWFVKDYSEKLIQHVKHVFEASDKKLMGAPGYDWWTFKMKQESFVVPHQMTISFVYVRPWEQNANVQPLVFTITTK